MTLQPTDSTVTVSMTATFTAAASGSPAPTVQWQRSNDTGATWTAIAGATSASYTTAATVAGDNGALFRAVFTNSAGSATTMGGKLTVTGPTTPAPGLSLLAGDIGGPGTIDGTGAAARFFDPMALAMDASGNFYVGDWQLSNIRKITPAGVVTTLAGPDTSEGATYGYIDGAGTAARFNSPSGLAVDGDGNVYVGDFGNARIRKVTPSGVVTTFAGGGRGTSGFDGVGTAAAFGAPLGVAFDSHGNLFVCDQGLHSIRKITTDGTVSTFAGLSSSDPGSVVDGTGANARFIAPQSIAIDASDNLYIGDGGEWIRVVTPSAVVTTIAGTAGLSYARGLAVDRDNNLVIGDYAAGLIRKISPAGVMTTFAGNTSTIGFAEGTGTTAKFYEPSGVVADASGNIWVAEEGNTLIRKITAAAVTSTFVGAPALFGSTDGTGAAARFNDPHGVAIDPSGNVVVADTGSSTLRKVTPAGVVTTFAGTPLGFGSDDGTQATAQFRSPSSVAYDPSGNLFVADTNNRTIRKIAPDGTVSTYAGMTGVQGTVDGTGIHAGFSDPQGIATDAAGNVYVADPLVHVIRKITTDRVVTTLAGQVGVSGAADGAGTSATFSGPESIAVDASGNLLVADGENHAIRKVAPDGTVSTLAGNATAPGSNDGTGAAAGFGMPLALTVDPRGNAYVLDVLTSTLRKVTPAGVVTTLAGVPGAVGVRLGTDPRLAPGQGIAWVPGGQLVFTSANAVVLFTLP